MDSSASGLSEKYVPALVFFLDCVHIWVLVFAACQVLLYHSLTKKYPWAEHLISLPKRGVGALSSVSTFNHKRASMSCLIQGSMPLKRIIGSSMMSHEHGVARSITMLATHSHLSYAKQLCVEVK